MTCCPAGVSGSDSQALSQAGSTDGIDDAPPAKAAAKARSETAQASKAAAKPHAQHKVQCVAQFGSHTWSLYQAASSRSGKVPRSVICTVCDPVKRGVCVSSTSLLCTHHRVTTSGSCDVFEAETTLADRTNMVVYGTEHLRPSILCFIGGQELSLDMLTAFPAYILTHDVR